MDVPPQDQLLSGYYRIARHYGYSLNHVLNSLDYEAIIITEGLMIFLENHVFNRCLIDDLDVSPDFLDYFQALYPLLKYDKTIWCISAWNDNGIDQKIDRRAGKRKTRQFRT